VDAAVGRVGLDRTKRLQPPDTTTGTAWWPGSPRPGEAGPAVIVGHLDTRTGPAVFGGLSMLRPGDEVSVRRADGSTALFAVTKVALYRKDRFPTAAVYGPTRDAELRLITCGGTYDRGTDSYVGNVVAFASLRSTTVTPPRPALRSRPRPEPAGAGTPLPASARHR
jgi:hypothetical protein